MGLACPCRRPIGCRSPGGLGMRCNGWGGRGRGTAVRARASARVICSLFRGNVPICIVLMARDGKGHVKWERKDT